MWGFCGNTAFPEQSKWRAKFILKWRRKWQILKKIPKVKFIPQRDECEIVFHWILKWVLGPNKSFQASSWNYSLPGLGQIPSCPSWQALPVHAATKSIHDKCSSSKEEDKWDWTVLHWPDLQPSTSSLQFHFLALLFLYCLMLSFQEWAALTVTGKTTGYHHQCRNAGMQGIAGLHSSLFVEMPDLNSISIPAI